jgi:hypothetical protein
MKIEIYEGKELVNTKNILTNFNEKLEIQKYILEKPNVDFSVIHTLKGDKELLNKSFNHELIENRIY